MPIGNQLMRARVGTYNFSRKALKPKISSLGENNFHTVHCLSKTMAYLILMLYYFLSICLVIFIFYKLLFFYAVTAYIQKSSNALLFINDYFRNPPFVALLLLRSGDVETNPGNGLAVHDFLKVPLIEAFITTHNFDIICLSETFLDCTVSQHDENIMLNGHSLLRADHPRNSKRERVCLYSNEHLPLIRRNDLNILQECLVTEINVDNEKCFFHMPL